MNLELLKNNRFQFISFVTYATEKHLGKGKADFNDHSNLLHVINGKGKVFFYSETFPLEKGVVIALPAFLECHFECEPGLEMLNVHYNIWNKEGDVLDDFKKLPIVFKPDYFDYCEAILKKIKKLAALPQESRFGVELLAYEIVLKHYSLNQLIPSNSCSKDERMSIIYKMLQSRDCVEYDAKKMAKSCFLSVSQMDRKFKHYFNESPRKFWERNKFKNVCHALLGSDKPLAEIANDFAFSYQSHFTKWFKNIAKTTPVEYRKTSSVDSSFVL